MSNNPTGRGIKFSAAGMLVTLGIVFGDIGTSPLYVIRATLREGYPVEPDFVLGILSLVIWTLTMQTTLKYVLITLRADNKGEGGIFSLFALLRQSKKWIFILAIIGGSLLLADGIITPAITVVSSIEGLKINNPGLNVVPIALGILAGLFAIQQFGTQKIGRFFGPMMLVWFLMLATLGAYEIREELMVLKAFNPYYGLHFLFTNPESILLLGAIFLCTTGAEALYTDLGHCGLKNIRMSWIFVKTSLILNYLGQGAWVLSHSHEITEQTNPFYSIMPGWFLPAGIVIATMAAIIASQALISGSYTIISEAISMNFWPKIKIKYPTLEKGQMYIASINWFLWLSCMGVVLLFRESANMEAAYGLSITITMIITTLLMVSYLSMKRVNRLIVMIFMIIYLVIEGSFLYANLFKFTHGGWFTILTGGILFSIMFSWYNGRKITNRYLRFLPVRQYIDMIKELRSDETVPKTATNLAFITKANRIEDIESKIIHSLFNTHPKRADHYWLIHVDITDNPHTKEYKVTHMLPGILTRVDFYLGFKVERRINSMFREVVFEMGKSGEIDIFSGFPSLRKYNVLTDFKFIIIDRLHVSDLNFTFFEKIVINFYILLIKISQSDVKSYGFDTSTVYVEQVPLGYDIVPKFDLKRK